MLCLPGLAFPFKEKETCRTEKYQLSGWRFKEHCEQRMYQEICNKPLLFGLKKKKKEPSMLIWVKWFSGTLVLIFSVCWLPK